MKILFVEDDLDYADILYSLFIDHGYNVEHVSSVVEGINKLKQNEYQLVITDLKMDGLDGFQFIEYLRTFNHTIKVIVLTSSGSEEDYVRGIDLEVEAFLSKSSSLQLILKRVEHTLKMDSLLKPLSKLIISTKEELTIDEASRQIEIKGKDIALSYYEYEVLLLLLKNKNKTISRREFLESIWVDANIDELDERTVDSHIKTIRAKTGVRSIVSIRRVGYKWLDI